MKKHLIILIGSLMFLFMSCDTAGSKINEAESSIEKVEKDLERVSKNELEELERQMQELEEHLNNNRNAYTDEQIKEIGRLKGRYTSIMVKKGLLDFKESLKDLGNQMEGFIEGITDSTDIKNK